MGVVFLEIDMGGDDNPQDVGGRDDADQVHSLIEDDDTVHRQTMPAFAAMHHLDGLAQGHLRGQPALDRFHDVLDLHLSSLQPVNSSLFPFNIGGIV
jgi:hypothetical protein